MLIIIIGIHVDYIHIFHVFKESPVKMIILSFDLIFMILSKIITFFIVP